MTEFLVLTKEVELARDTRISGKFKREKRLILTRPERVFPVIYI